MAGRRYIGTPDGITHFHDFRTTYGDGMGVAMCGVYDVLVTPFPGATFCDPCKTVDEARRTDPQYVNLYDYYDNG